MPVKLDYDAAAPENLQYIGWALPGTAESAPGWRICAPIFVGNVLDHLEWADGDDLLDNVWANRASLAYSPNAALSLALAEWLELVPAGIPGTNFDLGFAIPDGTEALYGGTRLRRVTTFTPGGDTGEFIVAGTALQTGLTIGATVWFAVRVPLG